MYHHLYLLADLSYQIGLIGLIEYRERIEIAEWLSGNIGQDPRDHAFGQGETADESQNRIEEEHSKDSTGNQEEDDPPDPILRIVMLNRWVFTKGDRDCYPSVPHGHSNSKTRKWPKLNPYNGRVFNAMHREDVRSRLDRPDMENLWRDSNFIAHCRDQIQWYSRFAPLYAFPSARRGRYVLPKW